MLEGLEISEVSFEKVNKNKDGRFDTDFWTKEPKINPNLTYKRIGDCLLKSQYGISISMNEEGIGYPIYRMNEIHNMMCDFEVSKSANITNQELEIFELQDKDVLFNRTNSFEWVGRTGIYYKKDVQSFVFASYLVRFVPDSKVLLPEYLTTYLNTKYGIKDIKRRARQSINQTNINPEEVKETLIPLLNLEFQKFIANHFDTAKKYLIKSQQTYQQAEALLLEELGLNEKGNGFESCSRSNYNIKSFSESFSKTGRIDAEYYQPKYEEYIFIIQNYKNGFEVLNSICNLKDQNYNPDYKNEYQYIELSNIGNSGDVNGCTKELGKDLPTRARRKVETNDIIVSSIEGSLQSCALIPEKYNNSLCSTGFYVINSDEINSETLLVLFKSEPLQNILKQNCSGTILTAINKPEFQNIPIPKIEKTTQEKIASLVQESFTLKKQSEELLELAKKAVEIAIEEGEEKGMEVIEKM